MLNVRDACFVYRELPTFSTMSMMWACYTWPLLCWGVFFLYLFGSSFFKSWIHVFSASIKVIQFLSLILLMRFIQFIGFSNAKSPFPRNE
jgi:hypothetical protein